MNDEFFAKLPIPSDAGKGSGDALGWKELSISECGEPLEIVPEYGDRDCTCAWPAYYWGSATTPQVKPFGELARMVSGNLARDRRVFVRRDLLERLNRAQQILNSFGYSTLQLVVVDGYRSIHVQRKLFQTYFDYLKKGHSNLAMGELKILAQRMVAYAGDTEAEIIKSPPNHATGGAVDVVLAKRELIDLSNPNWLHNAVIEFGGDFDEMMHPEYEDRRSALRFYEDEQSVPRENRRLLFNLMSAVGFTAYHCEWWHFQRGNQMDAFIRGEGYARYGIAEGFLP